MHSPAKINLGLSIHHRRAEDGFHYLHSIFLPISFGDEITISPANENRITTENLLPPNRRKDFERVSERGEPSANLIWKTMAAVETVLPDRIHVHLVKRIPTGAGLGGGSSNAGTLLRFLKKRYQIPDSVLLPIARRLGSDVPFFLQNAPRLVAGTGEELTPIEVGSGFGLLFFPEISIHTGTAYRDLKRPCLHAPAPEIWSLLNESARTALKNSDWSKLRNFGNDFEGAVFAGYPQLARIKKALGEGGADFVSMTGSGSTLYALVGDRVRLSALGEKMRAGFPELTSVPFEF